VNVAIDAVVVGAYVATETAEVYTGVGVGAGVVTSGAGVGVEAG